MEDPAKLAATIRRQAVGMVAAPNAACPFYGALCDELARDAEDGGPVTRVIAPFGDADFEAAYVLRLLGGIHYMVLIGAAPDLACHFPSTNRKSVV